MTLCQGQQRKIVYKYEYFDEFVTTFEMAFGNETGDLARNLLVKKNGEKSHDTVLSMYVLNVSASNL
jgi:hypothetical protein